MNKINILLSNDDGIDAPGIVSLADELKKFANVYVAAPLHQQSAVGHSITIYYPLRAHKHFRNGEFFGIAIDGTPADAVKLGVLHFFKEVKFDLVISGINQGENTAINIIYSGTVSAATEGTILNIPSIALSLATFEKIDFKPYAEISARLIKGLLGKKLLEENILLNINIPAVDVNEIRGVKFTQQGKSFWDDSFEVRSDPNGREYYWLTGKMVSTDEKKDSDTIALKENFISITPLHFDLTDHKKFESLKNIKLNL